MSMAINKALDEIKYRIPREILDTVFYNHDAYFQRNGVSIDEIILTTVIRSRLHFDTNIAGGAEILIDLSQIAPEVIDNYLSIYRIPDNKLDGRQIVSALSLSYGTVYNSVAYPLNTVSTGNQTLSLGQQALNAVGPIPKLTTARLQLIAPNTVLVKDLYPVPVQCMMRVVVENDTNLNHLQIRNIPVYADLAVLATKAFIYNKYTIQLDEGQIKGGISIGKFKEIVESYSDADELYRTMLVEKWAKIQMLNDQERSYRFLKAMIGGPK